ncbi:MAG: hypothetical protein ACKO5C_01845, partial [Ferruginibacter sp.]
MTLFRLLIIVSFLPFGSFAQRGASVDNRVKVIKAWYGEIQQMGAKNCNTKKKTIYDALNDESDQLPFEQSVRQCFLPNGFQVINAQLSGYEWNRDVNIYKRNGQIFFIFIKGASEAYTSESRYYCDENERVIMELQCSADDVTYNLGPQQK